MRIAVDISALVGSDGVVMFKPSRLSMVRAPVALLQNDTPSYAVGPANVFDSISVV